MQSDLADFPDVGRFKPIHVLDIPDEYQFMDPVLIELMQTACDAILDAMIHSNPTIPIARRMPIYETTGVRVLSEVD